MATIQGVELYGGATITRQVDGSGAIWRAFTSKNHATNDFGFTLTKNGILVPYSPFCTGRGSINRDGEWIATHDKDYFEGSIPGFVPRTDGKIVTPPNGYIRIFADQNGFAGTLDVNLAQFGVPPASSYQIKVVTDAAASGRKLRAGPIAADPNFQDAGMITVTTFAPGSANRVYAEAWRSATNGVLRIMADAGAVDHGFVDITALQV